MTETKPQYAGLDYSGPGSSTNRNTETGIRYGVISQRSISPDACEDIMIWGTDAAWEQACADAIAEAKANADDPDDIDEGLITEELGMDWESSISDYVYDSEGYYIMGCLDSDLMITKSQFYTYAQFCSPCVPGAGNLDNPFEPHPNQMTAEEIIIMAEALGFPRAYCLGHDWFDDNKAPYPVFSVADNTLVQPKE
jgi:hypothetical protein